MRLLLFMGAGVAWRVAAFSLRLISQPNKQSPASTSRWPHCFAFERARCTCACGWLWAGKLPAPRPTLQARQIHWHAFQHLHHTQPRLICSPSRSLSPSLFLQVHGSAPDIAGQDKANPLAMVLSAAMMCRYGLNLPKARRCGHGLMGGGREQRQMGREGAVGCPAAPAVLYTVPSHYQRPQLARSIAPSMPGSRGGRPSMAAAWHAQRTTPELHASVSFTTALTLSMQVADRLESAVTAALDAGFRTGDIMQPGCKQVGCQEMGEVVLSKLQ